MKKRLINIGAEVSSDCDSLTDDFIEWACCQIFEARSETTRRQEIIDLL